MREREGKAWGWVNEGLGYRPLLIFTSPKTSTADIAPDRQLRLSYANIHKTLTWPKVGRIPCSKSYHLQNESIETISWG